MWPAGKTKRTCRTRDDVQLLVRDPQANDYNSRYNGSITVKPGRSTIDLDYTRLPRYATRENEKPDCVDPRQITLLVFFLDQSTAGKPITLFFDNVRLAREATGKVEVRPERSLAGRQVPYPLADS